MNQPYEKGSEVKIVVMSDDELKSGDIERNRLNVPCHNSIPSIQNLFAGDKFAAGKNERSKSLDPTNNLDGFDPNKRRISSISSLGNWTGAVVVSDMSETTRKNGKW